MSSHSDLEDLRQQQTTQATESQSLSSQSQAMLNLNMKLKTSVLKSQVKAIDLELRKLEARQASEHLAMVKVSRRISLNVFNTVADVRYNSMPCSLTCCRHSSNRIRTLSILYSSSNVSPTKRISLAHRSNKACLSTMHSMVSSLMTLSVSAK